MWLCKVTCHAWESALLPPAYVVSGKVMFSVVSVCLCVHGGNPHMATADLFKLVHLGTPLGPSPGSLTHMRTPHPPPPNMFKLIHLGKRTVSLRLKSLLLCLQLNSYLVMWPCSFISSFRAYHSFMQGHTTSRK